jgi:hypothetical protein
VLNSSEALQDVLPSRLFLKALVRVWLGALFFFFSMMLSSIELL